MGIIRDREIQQALAAWPAIAEEASEEENLIRDFIVGDVIHGLAGHVDLTGVMLARTEFSLTSGRAFDLSGEEYTVNVNDTSRALIGQRAFLGRLVINASQSRLEEAKRILGMIDLALNE
jgi:hypothetical protein